MKREEWLDALLSQDTNLNPNSLLLKKYLLCVHNGWFRINSLAPDKKYSLGDYLLDDENVVLDFTRLSKQGIKRFLNWFINPHRKDATTSFLNGIAINEYRGYTAEVELSTWGRIANLLFYQNESLHWSLVPKEPLPNYQLTAMTLLQGEQGLVIGLTQSPQGNVAAKDQVPKEGQFESSRNVKRVLLTENMVEQLILTNLEAMDYREMLSQPHPFSIQIVSHEQRMAAMREYRQTQRLVAPKPQYSRMWTWFEDFLSAKKEEPLLDKSLSNCLDEILIDEEKIQIVHRHKTGEILVFEKSPELNAMVFCGGGVKAFGHVGAFKAFTEVGIRPGAYAGSSAGAIMSLLCYLGYPDEEILKFFRHFRQDNLIHYDIDRTGISDARAVKAAVDYMIVKKLNELINKYGLTKSLEGRKFLADCVFKNGKITFASLRNMKVRYPDCGLDEKLIVTATNVKRRKTRYFSYATTPDMEISEAVKISASFPVVYKPTILNGEVYNDGGIFSNLPTEVFREDSTTLLESEHGDSLRLVAFQFDNGCERSTLDTFVDKVHREGFLWNGIYGFLTGVKDPVSGWEKDRLKLLKNPTRMIIIPIDNVSATQFNLDVKVQNTLVNNGYQAAKKHIEIRYAIEEGKAINEELMYASFSSIEELLYYCCYRNNSSWFERIALMAAEQGTDEKKIGDLRIRYFGRAPKLEPIDTSTKNHLFSEKLAIILHNKRILTNMPIFEAIYPLIHKIPNDFIKTPLDLKEFKLARHHISLNEPLACLKYLKRIEGETHIFLASLTQILGHYCCSGETLENTCLLLKQLFSVLSYESKFNKPAFYGKWDLLPRHCCLLLKMLTQGQWQQGEELCCSLKEREEPLQPLGFDAIVAEQSDDDCSADEYSSCSL